jgi:hypothetical protein
MLQLLVTNVPLHRLEVRLPGISNSSIITVVNVGDDPVHLKVQNFTCNRSSMNIISEPAVIEPRHTAWLKLRVSIKVDADPEPNPLLTPQGCELSTALQVVFFSRRPQPGDIPEHIEQVQCLVTLPAGLPDDYTLHQEVFYATFPTEADSVLEEAQTLASVEDYRQN